MAPAKQHVVRVSDVESIDKGLNLEEADVPTPKDGQVLVRVILRPVNPTDVIQSGGAYGHKPPFIPGSEAVGVVEQFGPGAGTSGRLSKGQRVIATSWGLESWQQYIALPEQDLVAVPDDINDEVASQIFITTATVIGLVETAAVPKGEWLLQTAAASGLGRQVIQYAKQKGIKTINVVRRSEQVQELKDIGADEVINSKEEDVVERVQAITGGKGAWSALDPTAGRTSNTVVQALRAGGHDVVYGALEDFTIQVDFMSLLGKTVGTFIIYQWLPSHGPEGARGVLEQGFKLFQDGVLSAAPGKRFPFAQVKEAIAESQKPRGANSPKVFIVSE